MPVAGISFHSNIKAPSILFVMMTPTTRRFSFLVLFFGLYACTTYSTPDPTPLPASARSPVILTASPLPAFTQTPLKCLSQHGVLEMTSLETKPVPLQFRVYLPPCYSAEIKRHYPVLYLLHGQTYTEDQWVRLGAPSIADRLIVSGDVPPFIVVMPLDRSYAPSAGEYGQALIDQLVPYIDASYCTLPDRRYRAIGGLSRGAAWAIHLGLTHWETFGAFGAHSPALFYADGNLLQEWLEVIPLGSWPRIFIDTGDRDKDLGFTRLFDDMLTRHGVPHEWHIYTGGHDEAYWSSHVEEYLRWYAAGWDESDE